MLRAPNEQSGPRLPGYHERQGIELHRVITRSASSPMQTAVSKSADASSQRPLVITRFAGDI